MADIDEAKVFKNESFMALNRFSSMALSPELKTENLASKILFTILDTKPSSTCAVMYVIGAGLDGKTNRGVEVAPGISIVLGAGGGVIILGGGVGDTLDNS